MAKAPKPENEVHQDAWQRFERAVDVVANSPPQHKIKKKESKKRKTTTPKSRRPPVNAKP